MGNDDPQLGQDLLLNPDFLKRDSELGSLTTSWAEARLGRAIKVPANKRRSWVGQEPILVCPAARLDHTQGSLIVL